MKPNRPKGWTTAAILQRMLERYKAEYGEIIIPDLDSDAQSLDHDRIE